MSGPAIVISCEHGGADVPATYRALFKGHERRLASHRGHDPGALALARQFARATGATLHFATVTRLLVELNRSRHHPSLFSDITRSLSTEERDRILAEYYFPYRQAVAESIAAALARRRVVHLSVHSFTPVLDGETRRADAGLLYDPSRPLESRFARRWQAALALARPDAVIRRNYPYLGKSDGLVTALRRRFPKQRYVGLELEVNQRWPLGPRAGWHIFARALVATFGEVTNELGLEPA